jgi:hypothetical protein
VKSEGEQWTIIFLGMPDRSLTDQLNLVARARAGNNKGSKSALLILHFRFARVASLCDRILGCLLFGLVAFLPHRKSTFHLCAQLAALCHRKSETPTIPLPRSCLHGNYPLFTFGAPQGLLYFHIPIL